MFELLTVLFSSHILQRQLLCMLTYPPWIDIGVWPHDTVVDTLDPCQIS